MHEIHRVNSGQAGTIWAFYCYDDAMCDEGFALDDGIEMECMVSGSSNYAGFVELMDKYGVPSSIGMNKKHPGLIATRASQIALVDGIPLMLPLTGMYYFEGDERTGHGRVAVYGGIAAPTGFYY